MGAEGGALAFMDGAADWHEWLLTDMAKLLTCRLEVACLPSGHGCHQGVLAIRAWLLTCLQMREQDVVKLTCLHDEADMPA